MNETMNKTMNEAVQDQVETTNEVAEEVAEEKNSSAKKLNKRLARRFRNQRGMLRTEGHTQERVMGDFKKASAVLLNAKEQKSPITVRLMGVEPIKPSPQRPTVMMPICYYNGWKVVIPREEFFDLAYLSDEERVNETELTRRIYQYIGAEIDIIPLQLIKGSKSDRGEIGQDIVIASRKAAMEIKRNEYWFGTNSRRRKGEIVNEDLIHDGSLIEARVLAATRGFVYVEAFGAEGIIPAKDVSYAKVENCRDIYKAGDSVGIRIKNVVKDEDVCGVRFGASIKEARPDPRKDAFKRYVRNGIYQGKVTMLQTDVDKASGVFVSLPGPIDVFCKAPRMVMPEIGDIVSILIVGKDEENLLLWGSIKHTEKQSTR